MGTSLSKNYDPYDLVLDIRKIEEGRTEKGWPISISKELFYKMEEQINKKATPEEQDVAALMSLRLEENQTVVAVMGLFNRGKTFVVNRLASTNLPSDKKVHTAGLSFLSSKDNGKSLTMLDTAGTNSPLERVEKACNDDAFAQKKATEMFLQELAFSLADVVIVVVNELTWPDQEYLKTLQKKISDNPDNHFKKLFVIHNYNTIESEDELLYMWRKCIVTNQAGHVAEYQLDKGKGSCVHFVEDDPTHPSRNTVHFFLAKEDSPAGRLWNERCYSALRFFCQTQTVSREVLIKDLLIREIGNALRIYCKNPGKVDIKWNHGPNSPNAKEHIELTTPNTNPPQMSVVDGVARIHMSEWLKSDIIRDRPPPGDFIVKVEGDLTLKNDIVEYDGFRMLLTRIETEFKPKCDLIRTEKGMEILIDLPGFSDNEISGKVEPHIDHSEPLQKSVLIIRGERKLFYADYTDPTDYSKRKLINYTPESKNITRIISNMSRNDWRQASTFELKILLPQDISDDLDRGRKALRDGVLLIFLPLKKSTTSKPALENDF